MGDLKVVWSGQSDSKEIEGLQKEVAQLKERNEWLESEMKRRTETLNGIIERLKTLNDHGGI